jgi:hypothetical protein
LPDSPCRAFGNIVRGYAVIQFHGDFLQFCLTVMGWIVPCPREERSLHDSTLANRVKAGGELFLVRFILGVSPELIRIDSDAPAKIGFRPGLAPLAHRSDNAREIRDRLSRAATDIPSVEGSVCGILAAWQGISANWKQRCRPSLRLGRAPPPTNI